MTDGQTDGRTDGRNCRSYYSALHCEQCGRAVETKEVYNTAVAIISRKIDLKQKALDYNRVNHTRLGLLYNIINDYHNHSASARSRISCTDGATNSANLYITSATNAGLIVKLSTFMFD